MRQDYVPPPRKKFFTGFRLSPETRALIIELAWEFEIYQADLVTWAINDFRETHRWKKIGRPRKIPAEPEYLPYLRKRYKQRQELAKERENGNPTPDQQS